MTKQKLKKIKASLHKHPSVRHANDIIFNLAGDGGLYDNIRDYKIGEFAPQDLVENQLKEYLAEDQEFDNKDSIKADQKNIKDVQQYDDIDWIDFNTLKPVTAKDVESLIDDLVI